MFFAVGGLAPRLMPGALSFVPNFLLRWQHLHSESTARAESALRRCFLLAFVGGLWLPTGSLPLGQQLRQRPRQVSPLDFLLAKAR